MKRISVAKQCETLRLSEGKARNPHRGKEGRCGEQKKEQPGNRKMGRQQRTLRCGNDREPQFPWRMLTKHNDLQRNFKLISRVVSYEPFTQKTPGARIIHPKYETLQVNNQDNITTIIMNRPRMKNAISTQMYNEIMQALDEAGRDESIFTVITGTGGYFSSGTDLNNFINAFNETNEEVVKESVTLIRRFVCAFIDFPKPLIAVVNGPAIGIGVTILGLCDLVYATEEATFNTPFTKVGQSPEGCSSYTFPKIMGFAKATEILLFNKILTAREACDLGLVTEVFPDSTFHQEVWAKLKAYSTLPKNLLTFSKQLIRAAEKEKLHEVCKREFDLFTKIAYSDEVVSAVLNFLQKKAKL
ncbi:enoyl-CoA delta isomerase 2-like [Discoglossus pictus]